MTGLFMKSLLLFCPLPNFNFTQQKLLFLHWQLSHSLSCKVAFGKEGLEWPGRNARIADANKSFGGSATDLRRTVEETGNQVRGCEASTKQAEGFGGGGSVYGGVCSAQRFNCFPNLTMAHGRLSCAFLCRVVATGIRQLCRLDLSYVRRVGNLGMLDPFRGGFILMDSSLWLRICWSHFRSWTSS
jgi:hypothetical protein